MPPDTKHATVEVDGVVTRDVKDEDREVLRVPISSTRADREGDRFAKEALDDMAEQIREEQPLVFQNHGLAGSWMDAIPYDQSETIGTHFDAEVEESEDGEYDLFAYINPDGTHPEGERMLKQVRDEGQAIKFSVGFGINDADPIEDDAGNEIGREFLNVDLMEDSKVGIPANPDASAPAAASAKAGVPTVHPMVQMMQAMNGEAPEGTVATKDGVPVTDGGEPEETDDVDELREEVDALRDSVDSLAATVEEALEDDGDDEDDDDDDEDDEDDEEDEESASADEDLLQRVEELEASVGDGTGEAKTGDPTTEDPPVDRDADPDETSDAGEPDEINEHETIFD